jgi:putative DNA-binding protein
MSIATQASFAAALLDRTKIVPPGLVSWSSAEPSKRFGVYRNNVSSGLAQALAIRFPAAEAIVGKEFFAAMAKAYIEENPPRSPILLHYGAGLADFIATFKPAAGVPYLADIVRLENARVEAYHAIDMAPMAPEFLASVCGDPPEDMKFEFHPSFALIRSRYPIVTIWAMNSGEMPLAPIADWSAEDALVVRPELSVLTRRLPPGGAIFLEALASGHSLNSANERAQAAAAEFELTTNLAGMFQSGLVVAVSGGSLDEGHAC